MTGFQWQLNVWANRFHRLFGRLRAGRWRWMGAKLGRGTTVDRNVEFFFPIRMETGAGCKFQSGTRVKCAPGGRDRILKLGDSVSLGNNTLISCGREIVIGSGTLFAAYCFIIDGNHNFSDPEIPIRKQPGIFEPVHIGRDVWVGAHCIILPGVTIGDGAVIGANSTVTNDIPPFAVAVGSPARVIKYRPGHELNVQ